MAVPKDKTRLTITIHKETKTLMDELLSLHSNMSYSVLVEVSLLCYGKIVTNQLEKETNNEEAKGEENNGKN